MSRRRFDISPVTPRRRAHTLLVIVAALGLAGSGAAGTTFGNRPTVRADSRSGSGAFAGYLLPRRRVSMVAAKWRVPAITAASPPGWGSTWIGAQRLRPEGDSPFIQVGTCDRASGNHDLYTAFWSDTAHHFHAVPLIGVRPGDEVSATLTLARHRWTIRFVDHTSRTRREIVTSEETGVTLQDAEWLQEDPGTAAATREPYAATGPVDFDGLKVDRADPDPTRVIAQAMSLPRTTLVPTQVRGDSFSLTAHTA